MYKNIRDNDRDKAVNTDKEKNRKGQKISIFFINFINAPLCVPVFYINHNYMQVLSRTIL